MKTRWMTFTALVLLAGPGLACAHPVTMAHQRPNLFHDRAPHAHMHASVAHH